MGDRWATDVIRGRPDEFGAALFGVFVGFLGIVSQVAGDALTPMGVRPFHPISGTNLLVERDASHDPIANHAQFVIEGARS